MRDDMFAAAFAADDMMPLITPLLFAAAMRCHCFAIYSIFIRRRRHADIFADAPFAATPPCCRYYAAAILPAVIDI